MMGDRRVDQGALFCQFSLDRHVPGNLERGRPISRPGDISSGPTSQMIAKIAASSILIELAPSGWRGEPKCRCNVARSAKTDLSARSEHAVAELRQVG
jgi:hypothetical protein